jgi:ABC-type sugar transport system ATPase subunit
VSGAISNGATAPLALEVQGATKRFGLVAALQEVSLSVRAGEVVAVLGDNGAGKSTLMKCIAGAQRLDEGQLLIDGKRVSLRSAAEARALGVETVYQDLALFDNLSVVDNFFIGRELASPAALGPCGFLRNRAMKRTVAELVERLEVRIPDLQTPVGLMSGGQRQGIAVARAAAFASRVVLLDEPTAALGMREANNVLELISRFKERGLAVLLVSHNLEHVTRVADRAVVLRQGKKVGEAPATEASHERLVSMIVGSSHGAAAYA